MTASVRRPDELGRRCVIPVFHFDSLLLVKVAHNTVIPARQGAGGIDVPAKKAFRWAVEYRFIPALVEPSAAMDAKFSGSTG